MRWYLSAKATREWQQITGLPSFEHAESNLADFVESARMKKEVGTRQTWVGKWKPTPDAVTRRIEMTVSTEVRPEGPLPQLISVRDRGVNSGRRTQEKRESQQTKQSYPEWLIDDTTGITDARIFVFHAHWPRFYGELLPDSELTKEELRLSIAAPDGESVARIEWIDNPSGASFGSMAQSFAQAIKHVDDVRGN